MKRFSGALVSLSIALALSELGSGISRVALILLVYELTGKAVDLATLFAVDIVATLLATPLAGAAIDRMGPRNTMIAADMLRFAAILSALTVRGLWPIYGIAAVLSLGKRVLRPGAQHAGAAPRRRQRAFGGEFGAWRLSTLSYLLGNGIGAFVIQRSSISTAFILDAVTYVVSAAALLMLSVRPAAQSGDASRMSGMPGISKAPTLSSGPGRSSSSVWEYS